ncbi:MAG: TolC family protein [Verrucomicrobiota bacterium]
MKLWPLLLASVVFTGCARFTPRPISPEDNAARFEQRSLADESLHRYAETNLQRVFPTWPPVSWDLETLTLTAFYFNPDLAVARANYESVSAGKITAAQRPNPTVSVSPVYNTTTAIPSPWLVTATLDVPIETAGKRGYRRAQAAHLSDAARFTLASAAWDVRVRLRRALLESWSAERSESLLREQQDAQQTIVRLLEAEQAAGGITPAEVSRERMAWEQTKLARLDAESRRAQARSQLAGVMGVPASALDGINISFAAFEQPPAELPSLEARRRALLNRSDVLGGLADYAASESALQLEIARQYPDLHLNPGYEFDQGSDKWGVGLSFELPVLNQNRGPIAEAEARRRESAAKFNALQARVIGEIDAALAGCRNAGQKFVVATELLAQAQKQERATEAMAKAGELSRQAVAAARLETANIELARLDALLKAQQAAAALENAVQLPLELSESLLHAPLQMNSHP